MLSADYNHLSVAGHAVLAETIWEELPRQVKQPSWLARGAALVAHGDRWPVLRVAPAAPP